MKECGFGIITLYVYTRGHIEMPPQKNLKMRDMHLLSYFFVSSAHGRSRTICERGRSVPRPAGFDGQIPLAD